MKKLRKLYCFGRTDADDACAFVAEMLEAEAEHLRETEPYAVKTIERLEWAAHLVMSHDFCDD